jgi:glycine/D-amino acid oxidase-like deaminating enzyme
MAKLHLPLVDGAPVWGPVRAPALPQLTGSHPADVAVVGAGVVGLCLALDLWERGSTPILLEAERVGSGSTAASTALLLWETDLDFRRLSAGMGAERAARVWKGCLRTLDWMEECASRWGVRSFARAESVYYAATDEDRAGLSEEAAARQAAGLPSRFAEDARPWLGFPTPGALVSERVGVVNPVRLLEELLTACLERGIEVYERSPVRRIAPGRVEGAGFTLRTGCTVVAAGLRALEAFDLPPLVKQRNTYVLAVEGDPSGWRRDAIAWSTARPYTYLRRAGEAVIIGGEDLGPTEAAEAGDAPFLRLRARLEQMYPVLAGAAERARWAGLFPNSIDGLPFVGTIPGLEGADAVLGFGGNGIVFGVLGARLLASAYAGDDVCEELELYAHRRLSLAARARLRIHQAMSCRRLPAFR